jgi:small subunit ribosomal protein S8
MVSMPSSRVKVAIVKVLKDEGYVRDFQVSKAENNKSVLEIALKYFEGRPAIDRLDRVSRSGLRVYRGKDNIPKVMGGLGVAIVSTPAGIITDVQARAQGVGGEVIGTVA